MMVEMTLQVTCIKSIPTKRQNPMKKKKIRPVNDVATIRPSSASVPSSSIPSSSTQMDDQDITYLIDRSNNISLSRSMLICDDYVRATNYKNATTTSSSNNMFNYYGPFGTCHREPMCQGYFTHYI